MKLNLLIKNFKNIQLFYLKSFTILIYFFHELGLNFEFSQEKEKEKPSFMDRFLYKFQQKGQNELTHISTLRRMHGK